MNEHILIVDDTLGILKVLKKFLESNGYRTSMAKEGKKALNRIGSEDFDLVILDVDMPKMDGKRIAERIRSDYGPEDIKIVFLALNEKKEIDEDTMESLQIQGFIRKPFQKEDVLDQISEAFAN